MLPCVCALGKRGSVSFEEWYEKMKKEILAVLEPKKEYANLFLSFLQGRTDLMFDVQVFTEEQALEEYAEAVDIHVLLASEDSQYTIFEKKAGHIILLSEGRMVREQETYPTIYKFQSAEQILRAVFEICAEKEGDTECSYIPRRTRFCRQLAVFSPYGGSGKSTLSVVLGHLLGQGKRTLVVSLEAFSRDYGWLPEGQCQGVSRLIYYIKQGRRDLEMKISSLVVQAGNADYLQGVSHFLDLQEMEREDMELLLSSIREYSSYDVIIYDIGFLNAGLWSVLEQCDQVYEPIRMGMHGDWKNQLTDREQKILEKKLVPIALPEADLYGNIEYIS